MPLFGKKVTFQTSLDLSGTNGFISVKHQAFHLPSHVLGRCLEPDNNEGNEMLQWVLKLDGEIVPCQTMRKLTTGELVCESEVMKRADFDAATKQLYSKYFTLTATCKPNIQDTDDTYELPLDEVSPTVPEVDILDE